MKADSAAIRILFDSSHSGFGDWWVVFLGIIGTLVGYLVLHSQFDGEPSRRHRKKWIGYGFLIGAPTWALVSILFDYREYIGIRRAVQSGSYRVVQGTVEKFVPSGSWRHGAETLQVAGIQFSYMPSDLTSYYYHGSPDSLHAGMKVRVTDVGGRIIRLEEMPSDTVHQ